MAYTHARQTGHQCAGVDSARPNGTKIHRCLRPVDRLRANWTIEPRQHFLTSRMDKHLVRRRIYPSYLYGQCLYLRPQKLSARLPGFHQLDAQQPFSQQTYGHPSTFAGTASPHTESFPITSTRSERHPDAGNGLAGPTSYDIVRAIRLLMAKTGAGSSTTRRLSTSLFRLLEPG